MHRTVFVFSVVGLCAFPLPTHAEIGNPVRAGGTYLSVEAGYNHSDAPAAAAPSNGSSRDGTVSFPAASASAGGTTSAAARANASTSGSSASALAVGDPQVSAAAGSAGTAFGFASTAGPDTGGFLSADNGGYGGATFGYALVSPLFGVMNRVEAYGSIRAADEDRDHGSAIAFRSVDNNAAIALAAIPAGDATATTDQSLALREFGLRLKSDQQIGGTTFTLGLEPFFMRYEQNTRTSATLKSFTAFGHRIADVESDIYGMQFAIEGAIPLSGQFSLIGRGSAGAYHVNTDADFSSSFGLSTGGITWTHDAKVSDGDTRMGYRLGAETGVRYTVSSSTWLSVTGAVDYLSEVPTAMLPGEAGDGPASIAFDDLLDLRIGARLTFASY